jgi:peptide/nickel transport system substrate-binding protein
MMPRFIRTQRRTPLIIATALATAVTLAACGASGGSGGSSPSGSSSVSGQPVTGGTLTIDRTADIFTFDPYNTQDDRSIFTEMEVYDRLVKLGADGKTIEPELATSWTVAPGGRSATFNLRSGVQFSDGTPMTADDVAYSLTRAADQKGSWGFLFSPVSSVLVVNPSEIKIVLSQPFAPLLPALSTFAASIYSKANAIKYGAQMGNHPLGTGAFALGKWDKGSQLELDKNTHYWQKGKPYLDKVIYKVVADDNARVLQLEAGAADALDAVPPDQINSLKQKGMSVTQVNGSAVIWVTLNEAKKPLNEANVRLALSWAMDRESIAKSVYSGLATPAKSIMPSSTLYYDPNQQPAGYDLAKAKQYLQSSSVPNGFSFNVSVPSGDPTTLATAQIWQASLKQIGITLNIVQLEATTAQDEYNTEKYTARISPWTNDTPDPDELMGVAMDYQPQNGLHTGFHNEQARTLVTQGRAEPDATKRAAIYQQLQLIANQQQPFIPVVEIPRLFAATVKVGGFAPNTQGKYAFVNVWKVK